MKTERELKAIVCLHHIATCISVAASGWAVIKGTGSRVRDTLAGIFLAVQLFALVKVVLETAGKREETLADKVIQLRNQIGKTGGGRLAASACTALLLFASLFFKIGVPLCLLERKKRFSC